MLKDHMAANKLSPCLGRLRHILVYHLEVLVLDLAAHHTHNTRPPRPSNVFQVYTMYNPIFVRADELSAGNKRRLCVATQLINCTPLLVLHDIMVGMNEGDSLAIMRCISEYCK